MSDFTKEELILLCCWSANRFEQVGDSVAKEENTISLSHKIQDMIINYCDHDWENPCCGCPDSSCLCNKCGIKL
jgi:hypothetical protein